jgi:menaquinone-specific isochorismate synthase
MQTSLSEERQIPDSGMLKRALAWLEGDVAQQNMAHAFEANKQSGIRKFLSLCMPVEISDPLAVLEFIDRNSAFNYYWERPDERFSLVAQGCVEDFKTHGIQRFENVQQWVQEIKKNHYRASMVRHRLANLGMFGGFSFFDKTAGSEWEGFDGARFIVPEWSIVKDGLLRLLIVNIAVTEDAFNSLDELKTKAKHLITSIFEMIEAHRKQMRAFKEEDVALSEEDLQPIPEIKDDAQDKERWKTQIEHAKEMIGQGYFEKIVLAKKVEIQREKPIRLTRVANTLRRTYPECATYFIQFNQQKALIGSTPEILASFKPSYILTEALAGTTKRGRSASEDAMYEQKLLESTKDLEEHQYVVDAIKLQLSRFVHQVDVAQTPTIKKLHNVQHLYTPITAWKDRPVNITGVIHAMHPTPAVGGSPNGKAVKYIQQFENFERGWYAAPVGWMNLSDEADFHVAIRSARIDGTQASLYAGCGIVADSDAEMEWKEANLKLLPILSALRDA